jgi:hypothetical protein
VDEEVPELRCRESFVVLAIPLRHTVDLSANTPGLGEELEVSIQATVATLRGSLGQ